MKQRRPDASSEARLERLRREAERTGRVGSDGVRPEGAPFPRADAENGYYGLPLLKAPVWTWEVPAYFFVGGAAGAAACIGFFARIARGESQLTRNAQWVAAIGAAASGPLLIADLGRPERFLAMLRVFKPQSPMSVGAWLLTAFAGSTAATVVFRGHLRDLSSAAAAITGLGMATYTGVLLGATAIPVWATHASLLPVHFGTSALASAVSVLELLGHSDRPLNTLGRGAAAIEGAIAIYLEQRDEAKPLHEGANALTTRIASAFSGPIPLAIRLLYGRSRRARQAAAVSALLGSCLTRVAWIEAGKTSARSSKAD